MPDDFRDVSSEKAVHMKDVEGGAFGGGDDSSSAASFGGGDHFGAAGFGGRDSFSAAGGGDLRSEVASRMLEEVSASKGFAKANLQDAEGGGSVSAAFKDADLRDAEGGGRIGAGLKDAELEAARFGGRIGGRIGEDLEDSGGGGGMYQSATRAAAAIAEHYAEKHFKGKHGPAGGGAPDVNVYLDFSHDVVIQNGGRGNDNFGATNGGTISDRDLVVKHGHGHGHAQGGRYALLGDGKPMP